MCMWFFWTTNESSIWCMNSCFNFEGTVFTQHWKYIYMYYNSKKEIWNNPCWVLQIRKYRRVSNIRRNFSRQLNCWSLRCSWSIACRRCSNYIFILNLTPGFNGLGKDNYKMRRETIKFWDLVRLILETLRYVKCLLIFISGTTMRSKIYADTRIDVICHMTNNSLQRRVNGHDGVSNHRRLYCSLNRLFWRRSKKAPKLRVTGFCAVIHR